jgi:nucleotide-binding universal stress UspA family protein
VDAFPDEKHLCRTTAETLVHAFPTASIIPVYILSEDAFLEHGYSKTLRPALKPMVEKKLAALISDLATVLATGLATDNATGNAKTIGNRFEKPRVVIARHGGRGATAHKLHRFAEKVGAQVIAVGSHGRKGLSRFILGSFSEALLTDFHIPIILTGPRTEAPPTPPEFIVFPTDFSEACELAFDEVLKLARFFKAEVHLFHKTMHYVDPFLQSGVHLLGGGWVSFENFVDDSGRSHESEAHSWLSRAAASGVQARYICENFREPVSEAIVEYAGHLQRRTKPGRSDRLASVLITMVPQSGPVASAILGSTTRDVIRLSPCPLYLIPQP